MILEQASPPDQLWDVCIVGSGPIGMALALECERLGCSVLVLESGRARADSEIGDASYATIVDPRRHASMDLAVCRALGGTSWMWGGRCVAFDDIDFLERDYVPDSKWPITHDDIKSWYVKTAEYLLCGDATFSSAPPYELGPDVTIARMERWSRQPRLMLMYQGRIARSERVTFCLGSTVIDLEFGDCGQSVTGIVVTTHGGKFVVRARDVIIAAGGVESTRLLLAVQRKRPNYFGGVDGPLGRYYMGHVSGKIASIVFSDDKAIDDLDFQIDDTKTFVRRRFTLTPAAQQAHALLNTAFWPDNPPFYDPSHRSAVLSAVFLALAAPIFGRQLLPEAIRRAHVGSKPYPFAAHLRNVVAGAPGGVRDLAAVLRDRFLSTPRKPGFVVRNRGKRYALHYQAEQAPSADSRVVLNNEKDRFGLPRATIDLRYTDKDVQSVISSHRILDSALRASGTGRLEYWYPQEQMADRVLEQAADGYHQVGTTRMGRDPTQSVVDQNLKVHGVANLHIASTSVLPTTGQANSTFVGTALGLRLAHHLATLRGNCHL
jgi:choline dehydrogenase-like flavoprotein